MEKFSTSTLCKTTGGGDQDDRVASQISDFMNERFRLEGICWDCRAKFSADGCTVCWDCLYARYQQLGQCA